MAEKDQADIPSATAEPAVATASNSSKKKKKKKPVSASAPSVDVADGSVAESRGVPTSEGAEATTSKEESRAGVQAPVDVHKTMQRLVLGDRDLPRSAPRTEREALDRDYKFWKTQPVPGLGEYLSLLDCLRSRMCEQSL